MAPSSTPLPLMCLACVLPNLSSTHALADQQNQNTVEGDSTVGGFHVFEVHQASADLFIRIAFVVILIILIYLFIKKRAKKAMRDKFLSPILQQLTGSSSTQSPHNQLLALQLLQTQAQLQNQSQPALPAPCNHAPRRQCTFTEDSEDAHV